MKRTPTEEKLIKAVQRAVEQHDVPNAFGLSELETHYRGPACGSAGSIVRRWPTSGIQVEKPADVGTLVMGVLVLRTGKHGRQTVVEVSEEIPTVPRKMVLFDDFTGLPRAWAIGAAHELEVTRKRAREHLEAYCRGRREVDDLPEMCDPARYTERVEDVRTES